MGNPEAFGAGDVVHIGSCTKAFTALLIADAVSERAVRFSTTLGSLDAKWKRSPWANTTIDALLRHEAGLPENAKWWGLAGVGTDPVTQRRDVLNHKWLPNGKPPVAGKFTYSNVGYVVLGAVADIVYGMPFEAALQLRIARPNLLQTAGFGVPDKVYGHHLTSAGFVPTTVDNPPVMNSAGRIHLSMGDWLRSAALHTEASRYLHSDIRRKLQASSVDGGYAGGWIVTQRRWASGTTLTHAGSNTFWLAVMWVSPKTGRAFAAVANAAGPDIAKGLDRVVGAMITTSGTA
jgi:CubicO group peptidase (beta-lactamase class C family)